MSSSGRRERGRFALVLETLRGQWVTATVWVVGGGVANAAMILSLKREMDSFPGGATALAASVLPAAEAMRPLRWPAERLDTLGGYTTYHNLTLFTLFLAIYAAIQGARSIRGAEDHHVLEEILATGWSRASVVRDRAVGFVLTAAAITLGLGAGVALGFIAAGEPQTARALQALVAPGLGMLVGYGLGLLLAQLTASAPSAAGLASGLLVVAYVVENTWEDLGAFAWLRYGSPFHYVNRSRTLVPGQHLDLAASAVLIGLAGALVLLATWAFVRRDYASALWVVRRRTPPRTALPGRVTRGLLHSTAAALVLRGRFGILAWSAGAFVYGTLMLFLEPSVLKMWSWFATFMPGGVSPSASTPSEQYIDVSTTLAVPFVAGVVVSQAAGWVRDLAQGRVEAVLAAPVSTARLVLGRLAAAGAASVIVGLGALAGVLLGGAWSDVRLDAPGLLRVEGACLLLGLGLAGVASVVVAVFPGTLAVTVFGVVLGASYLVGFLVGPMDWPAWVNRFSLVTLFGHPYLDWVEAVDAAVLGGLCVVGVLVGGLVVDRRPKAV